MRNDNIVLVETAWEVCNQVGGIYTVLRTKAPAMMARWGSGYLMIGPYNQTSAQIEFEPAEPDELVQPVIEHFKKMGRTIYYGRWLIPGEPRVFLVDPEDLLRNVNAMKASLWERYRVSTIAPDSLVDEALAFSFLSAEVIQKLQESSGAGIIAHFHEWMSGAAIPELSTRKGIRTVFTTHATLVGRYIAGDNRPLYQELDTINADDAARHYNIEARHQIERLAAQRSHFFTTVSDVTAKEAAKFLDRRPDFVLPNGLNAHHFTALHEFQNLHRVYKERIQQFVMGHFFPSYTFDLDRTLYFLISGRYEYRNKGMDVYIKALERLNRRLMEEQNPPTIVAYIITNRPTAHVNVEVLRGSVLLHELTTLCKDVQKKMGEKLFTAAIEKKLPEYEELIPRDTAARLKRAFLSFSRKGLPAVCTHEFSDTADPVMLQIAKSELTNAANHPVKIIYHPEFVSATNPPLNLDYDQFVRGCHLGIFPSYYEPWGYTPLECIALGLPTVTTALSGFGAYVQENIAGSENSGIYVLKRGLKSDQEIVIELGNYLWWFVHRSRRERIDLRNRAERLTEHFDWTSLAKHYDAVHGAATQELNREAGL